MDWAKDQLGNPVRASERGLFSYAFYCGGCGARVFRKAGPERRPHFAHYGHSGRECEDYHPSSGLPPRTLGRGSRGVPASRTALLRSGLLLEPSSGGYLLTLKLPRMPSGPVGIGEIEVRSGFGVRTYTASQLQRPQFVPLIPGLPLVEVIGSSDLEGVANAIVADVSGFRSSDNYFRASDGGGGRLLGAEEPLEWGERYRLLTRKALVAPPLKLSVLELESRRGWFTYDVGLPAPAVDSAESAVIADYLRKRIDNPRARLFLVDPPAHHIETDGTHVFPLGTGDLTFRRTAVCDVSIEGSIEGAKTAHVRVLDDERVEITDVGGGDFNILVDGCEEFLGRIEECELFRPAGVRVVVGNRAWEIFEPGLRSAVQNRSEEILRIDCPTLRIAEYVELGGEWAREGATLTLLEALRHPAIDAGNFGALTWPVTRSISTKAPPNDAQALARRAWLEGIAARFGGAEALVPLRSQWGEAPANDFAALTLGELEWLRPHIQVARLE